MWLTSNGTNTRLLKTSRPPNNAIFKPKACSRHTCCKQPKKKTICCGNGLPQRTEDENHKTGLKVHDGFPSQCASFVLSLVLYGTTAGQASALLNSPNAQIPRSVDAALRRSIPAFNPVMKKLQQSMEDIQFLLRIPQRKPWGNMAADVQAALSLFEDRSVLLSEVPAGKEEIADEMLTNMFSEMKKLQLAISTQQPEIVSLRVAEVLRQVASAELLQAPGLPFVIPKAYASMPRLVGRAVVELTIEKPDGSLAFLDAKNGGYTKEGHVQLTLDGYSAPITAGNFVVNVLDRLYDDCRIQSSYSSVIVSTPPSKERPPVPLEIMPAGEFDPVYRSPLDVQGGELPVLPLSIAGAVSMTRVEGTDSYLSGNEWFVYKFDKQQAGLAGLAFDEGSFGVFGYVTKGMDTVARLQTGDVIVAARLVEGADKLVRPAS